MFRSTNPFEERVVKATSESLTTEDWQLIIEICDKVVSEAIARECVAAILKRLLHRNANVVLYALTLTEALVKNCDLLAKREVASRAFTTTLSRVLADPDAHAKVKERILYLIQDWTEQFKTDASLNLMEELYSKLKTQGFRFPSKAQELPPSKSKLESQREEEEFQLALALSLSETESKTSGTRKPLLSKSESNISKTNTALASGRPVTKPKEKFQVRALFDFIPSEKGELGFHKGDIIKVIDDQYKNWWKGELHSQIGIFPANYVEKLPESVSLDDVALLELEASVNKDAAMIDELLRNLHALNPNDNIGENEKLHEMYSSSLLIRPKLLKLISAYSLKKESLMNLNEKFVKARTEFERLQYGHAPSHISHGHPGHTNRSYSQGAYPSIEHGMLPTDPYSITPGEVQPSIYGPGPSPYAAYVTSVPSGHPSEGPHSGSIRGTPIGYYPRGNYFTPPPENQPGAVPGNAQGSGYPPEATYPPGPHQ